MATKITREWLHDHFEYSFSAVHGDYWIGYDDQAGHGCTITLAVELDEATYYEVDAPVVVSQNGKGYSTSNTFLCSTTEQVKAFLSLCGNMTNILETL